MDAGELMKRCAKAGESLLSFCLSVEIVAAQKDLSKHNVLLAQRSDLAEDWGENAIASGRQQSHHQRRDGPELSSQSQRHLCHDFKGGSFERSFSSAMDVFEVLILKEEIFDIL